MILMIFFVSLQEVVAVSTFGQLFYYTLANASDVRLRQASGKSLVLPALGTISCLSLLIFIFFTSLYAWIAGLIAAVGVVYYIFRK